MQNNNIRAKRFFQYFAQTNRCHNGNGYLIRNHNLVFCHNSVNYLEIWPVNRKYWLKHSQNFQISDSTWIPDIKIRVITKLPNSEQSNKGKVKTHKYINRQNQSTTGKL
jgi:hypothetical protein